MRDFLASRVVDGRQQIRAAISFHEFGRLVMWPYGYTTTDVPADMTVDDHDALVAHRQAHGRPQRLQARAGERPVHHVAARRATTLYGMYRIFAYTFEMSAVDYPDDSTDRDRDRAQQGGRPVPAGAGLVPAVASSGAAVRDARCGAFDDDLEVARGWSVNPDGTDTAPTAGALGRAAIPARRPRRRRDAPARRRARPAGAAFVTGRAGRVRRRGVRPRRHGRRCARAPITLPAAAGQRLTFRWLFAHRAGATTADHLRAIVEAEDGTRTVVWEQVGAASARSGAWRSAGVSLDPWAGQTIRIRFEARGRRRGHDPRGRHRRRAGDAPRGLNRRRGPTPGASSADRSGVGGRIHESRPACRTPVTTRACSPWGLRARFSWSSHRRPPSRPTRATRRRPATR